MEAMVLMVKIQSEEGGSSARRSQSLMYEVQTILTKFVERLSGDEKSNFYRRVKKKE